jgi:dCTP deaminase
MILSNVEIIRCLEQGLFSIDSLADLDPTKAPFNTSAVDLRLGTEILVPDENAPVQLDLRRPGIARFWAQHSRSIRITEDQPFSLPLKQLVLANTLERVNFPLNTTDVCCAHHPCGFLRPDHAGTH